MERELTVHDMCKQIKVLVPIVLVLTLFIFPIFDSTMYTHYKQKYEPNYSEIDEKLQDLNKSILEYQEAVNALAEQYNLEK